MTTFYQKERGRYQQPGTQERCLNCGAIPSEHCHLVDWLKLRIAGYPAALRNAEWNLAPLCRPCHWLFDGRYQLWVGSRMKAQSIKGREQQALDQFLVCLEAVGIQARLPTELDSLDGDELDDGDYPAITDVWITGIGEAPGCALVTSAGYIVANNDLTEAQTELAQAAWESTLRVVGIKTGKAYKEYREQVIADYEGQRRQLLEMLKPQCEHAIANFTHMFTDHSKYCDLKVDSEWAPGIRIVGFDFTRLKAEGYVRVQLWQDEVGKP